MVYRTATYLWVVFGCAAPVVSHAVEVAHPPSALAEAPGPAGLDRMITQPWNGDSSWPSAGSAGLDPQASALLYGAAIKLSIFAVALAALAWGLRWMARRRRSLPWQASPDELRITDALAVAPGAGVKLLQVGTQQLVVGHDRSGLKALILLPSPFSSIRSGVEQQLSDTPPGAPPELLAARTFRQPRDTGWDLNQMS